MTRDDQRNISENLGAEYERWLSTTFRKENSFLDKRPLMVRIKFLEEKVEELCQQIEKLSWTEQDDWNR